MLNRALVFSSAVLLTAGCAEKDKTPPPAPMLDAIATTTPDATIFITGSAEYGSSISITGGAAPATGNADAFTARFRIEVTLTADQDNKLQVVATDAAGNHSAPSEITITQDSSHTPAMIDAQAVTSDFVVSPSETTTVVIVAQVTDAFGIPVPASTLGALLNAFSLMVMQSTGGGAFMMSTGFPTVTSSVAADGQIVFQATSDVFTPALVGTYRFSVQFAGATPVMSNDAVVSLGGTALTATISNLRIGGLSTDCALQGSPLACVISGGQQVDFDVSVDDNIGLVQIDYSAFFPSVQNRRNQSTLVTQGTTLPYSVHFTFSIPDGAGFEDVPLVVHALDSKNTQVTVSTLLRNLAFNVAVGRGSAVAAQNPAGGPQLLNGPTDLVVDSSGTMFVGNNNGGVGAIVQVTSGGVASLYSGYNGGTGYMALASNGDIFLTRSGAGVGAALSGSVRQISAAAGNLVSVYLNAGVELASGVATMPAVGTRAMVNTDFSNGGPADADTLVIDNGTTVHTYEFQTSCAAYGGANICVDKTSATLVSAIATNDGSDVTATALTGTSACGSPSTTCVLVTANLATATLSISKTGGSFLATTNDGAAMTLEGGRGETLLFGDTTTGTNKLFRYPENLAPGLVFGAGGMIGSYVNAPVGTAQSGIAVRDLTTSGPAPLGQFVRDLITYHLIPTNPTVIRAVRETDNLLTTVSGPLFALTDTTVPGNGFNTLYDLVLAQNGGCLIASDRGAGRVLLLDVRDPTNATPLTTVLATGLSSPRGLALDAAGNLYVAEFNRNRIVQITPTADPTDCF